MNSFIKARYHMANNMTKVFRISKINSWAFKQKHKIKSIFSSPGYPKHYPNTVMPDYSCIMLAKYELMEWVSQINHFNTKYIAWLDIGLFREIAGIEYIMPFKLHTPPALNVDRVAYAQVECFKKEKIHVIFKTNIVLVCGCFFVGNMYIMAQWTKHYLYYAEKYIELGLANTDQQVLYAMIIDDQKLHMHIYTGDWLYNKWFYLGYLCRNTFGIDITLFVYFFN